MAIGLEGGAVGVSFVLLPDEKMEEYTALQLSDFVEKNPRGFALEFGHEDPLKEMIGLAAINAICQHVMREAKFEVDSATDSLGLLSICEGMAGNTICPLADAAVGPVKSFITKFRDEFEEYIREQTARKDNPWPVSFK